MEIIEEKLYQKIKKEMNKTDDYFTETEMEKIAKKIDVILT
jgi:hypothetical protein